MSRRHRGFCFTINNYEQSDIDAIDNLIATYCCYGKELAPTTGTPHLQGFVYFPNARGLAGVIADFPRGAHLEISRGTGPQNRDYCSKGGDFTERGVCPLDSSQKGELERAKWDDLIRLAELGDFEQIRTSYPQEYFLRLRNLEHIHRKRRLDLDTLERPEHQWFVGPTGCGKSSRARAENPGAYIKEPESRWWDNYAGEDSVIIDDVDKFHVSLGGHMKRWLDRYAFQAEMKGSMMKIRPKKIIVTSQYHPSEIWSDEKTVDAIMRRIEVVEFPSTPAMFVSTFNSAK